MLPTATGASTEAPTAAASGPSGASKGKGGDEEEEEDWSMGGKKGKKGGKGPVKGKLKAGGKGQAAAGGGKQKGGAAADSGGGSSAAAAEVLQLESLAAKLLEWHPELEQGLGAPGPAMWRVAEGWQRTACMPGLRDVM